MQTYNIGIIGTAGRKDDASKLSIDIYRQMYKVARNFIKKYPNCKLISGGAAYADHLAVILYLEKKCSNLLLHLPCRFYNDQYFDIEDRNFRNNPGGTCNYYHRKFSQKLLPNINYSLTQLRDALLFCDSTISTGLFERNTKVAEDSNILLAFTFGNKGQLKYGGTKDTMDKFIAQKGIDNAYHFDLNSMKLYKVEK